MAKDVVSNRIPEWKLQAAGCAELESMGQDYAGSLEGVRLTPRNAQMAKATGMKAGEPDIRLYFDGGRCVFAELKGEGGSLTPGQRERIPMLRGRGFVVHVVFAVDEQGMRAKLRAIVDAERGNGSHHFDSASWWPRERRKRV